MTDFGAFIDLGGADGLLHISEMSWGRVEHPKKVFKIGDQLKVLIKEISGSKIALSLKFDDANPWKDAASKYAVGNVVTGKVARMTDFGAFVKVVDFNETDKKISLSVKAMIVPETTEEESDADVVSVDIDAVIAAQSEEDAE